jgi:hypothetical protein
MFGRQRKWDAKAEVERGMCEEEDASVVAAREEQEGIISKVLEENPFDQFGPDVAPAAAPAPKNPFNNMGGGKRRNKTRKARSRRGRKGLKSRKA